MEKKKRKVKKKEKKKDFVEPELVKYKEKLDEVTMLHRVSPPHTISDRNAKQNFAPVDRRKILALLSTISVETWNYKNQNPSIRHIGPMSQDFSATFGVGEDNRHINMVDAFGVALSSIQALYEMVQERDARIEALEQKVEESQAIKELATTL